MILDKQLLMSSAQAVTTSAASTNVIDQGAAGDAVGKELYLVVQVREAVTADGAATVNFVLETDSAENFGTKKTLFDSGAIGKATLTLNSEPIKVKVPVGALRYLRGYFTVGTGPLTAGKFDMFLTPDVQIN